MRSRALIASAVGLAFSAILFQNIVIATVFLILVALLLGEYSFLAVVRRNPKRWFAISKESSRNKILYPGDLASNTSILTKKVRAGLKLHSELPFLMIDPDFIQTNEHSKEIYFNFRTPFSGEYQIQKIGLSIQGPLKLFSADSYTEFSYIQTVFPRVLQIATDSSKILARIGIGERPTNMIGQGTEFHEMRNYQPGDDYRHVNWKASARLNELFVNERQRESEASYYLILDSRVEEYSERDRVASAFLHIANMLTALGVMFGVLIHDGKEVKALKEIDVPQTSLNFAVSVALDLAKVRESDLPEELKAISSYAMRSNQKMLADKGYQLLSEIENAGRTRLAMHSSKSMLELIGLSGSRRSNSPVAVYFSALHGSMSQIIEIAMAVTRNYSGKFLLVAPTMPWVTTESEEEAYEAYTKYHAKLRALELSHIEYAVVEPSAIAKKLFDAKL